MRGEAEPLLAVGATHDSAILAGAPVSISGSSAGEEWIVTAPGIELTVSPETPAATSPAIAGFDQLCRVHGTVVIAGEQRELELPGRRGSRPELELELFDSIRDVGAWFAPSDGVSLTSLRPRGAKGHDRDVVAASVFDSSGAVLVVDPRLSTTYAADGHPSRFGVELWLEQENESEEVYPRRAAGEALGAKVALALAAFELEAYVLRCHSRGEEGLGVYVLARHR